MNGLVGTIVGFFFGTLFGVFLTCLMIATNDKER